MMSQHATCRARARCIPPMILDWLWDHGSRFAQGNNTEIIAFDRKARRRLESLCGQGPVRRLGEYLDAYMVVRDGTLVTVGHRYRRIRRL